MPEVKAKRGRPDVYTLDYKSRAVRLYMELGSQAAVLRKLREEYPDTAPPHRLTIMAWLNKYREVGEKRITMSDDHARLWSEVELAALDRLIDEIKSGKIAAGQLSIVAGIAADKRLRVMELEKGKTQNIRIHQLIEDRRKVLVQEIESAKEQPAIEVEYEVLPSGD